MSSAGSVSNWIRRLQAGDQAVAQQLWQRYFQQLVNLARTKLRGNARQAADEEDVAITAFETFCRGAEHGRYPQLHERDGLWQLLVVITERRAIDLMRREGRLKRGGDKALGQAAVLEDDSDDEPPLAHVESREPTPEFAAQVAEECRRLLDSLQDPNLETVAVCKMEGFTHDEIAAKLGCVRRTVDRRLALIRRIWQEEESP
jgi:RNA polymerase sigma factor (sigma-70 family)